MTAHHTNANAMISLPSIQEMFPEHLMGMPCPDKSRHIPSVSENSLTAHRHISSPATHSRLEQGSQYCRSTLRVGADTTSQYRYPSPSTYSPTSSSRSNPSISSAPALPSGSGLNKLSHQYSHAAPAKSRSASNHSRGPSCPDYSVHVLKCDPSTFSLEPVDTRNTSRHHKSTSDPQNTSIGVAKGSTPAFRVDVSPPVSQSPFQQPADEDVRTNRPMSLPSSGYPSGCVISFPISGSTASGNHATFSEDGTLYSDEGEPDQNWKVKKHQCPHCAKRFNRPSSLQIHVNTHTGARPFRCPYPNCGREFNVNSNMRRHYRNHVRPGYPYPNTPPSPSDVPRQSHRVPAFASNRMSIDQSGQILSTPVTSPSISEDSGDELDYEIDDSTKRMHMNDEHKDEIDSMRQRNWREQGRGQRTVQHLSSSESPSSAPPQMQTYPRGSRSGYPHPPRADQVHSQSDARLSNLNSASKSSSQPRLQQPGSKYLPSSSVYQASTDLNVSTTLRPAFYAEPKQVKQETAW